MTKFIVQNEGEENFIALAEDFDDRFYVGDLVVSNTEPEPLSKVVDVYQIS